MNNNKFLTIVTVLALVFTLKSVSDMESLVSETRVNNASALYEIKTEIVKLNNDDKIDTTNAKKAIRALENLETDNVNKCRGLRTNACLNATQAIYLELPVITSYLY